MIPDFFLPCGAFLRHSKQASQELQKNVDSCCISFCRSSAKRQVKTSQDDSKLCQLQLLVNKSQVPHKFSAWILFASAPVNSYSIPFSSFSFPSLFTYKQIVWIQSAIVCCHNNFVRNSLLETEHYGHKILMQWSSWSKHVFERDDNHAKPFLARFPAKKKAGCNKCIARFITYSSPGRANSLPSLAKSTLRHNQILSDGWFTKFSYP